MDFVTLVGGGVWGEPGLAAVLRTAHLIGRPLSQPGGEANRHELEADCVAAPDA